jgi:gamma-glutamylcyclotransferase (GGCT)/AIG2-like uncharacterized protein YtfP
MKLELLRKLKSFVKPTQRENAVVAGGFMTTKVFAYGSLSEGMVHFNRLSAFILNQQAGRIRGTAYRLKVGYPVLLKEGSFLIPGQVLELKSSEILMALLDELFGFNPQQPEKSLCIREQVEVSLEDGQIEAVWVYFLNPKKLPDSAVLIDDGDWLKAMKENPLLTDKLTERQVCYIKKLGAASGRDIIPINDLALYRELMGLELIVDKGRRLALSKLGREVYRYLG